MYIYRGYIVFLIGSVVFRVGKLNGYLVNYYHCCTTDI